MNCREAETLLSADWDGALDSTQRAALDKHVAGCSACRQWRANVAGVGKGMRASVLTAVVPDSLHEWHAVRRQLRTRDAATAGSSIFNGAPRRLLWATTGLAAALVLGVFWGMGVFGPNADAIDIAQVAHAEFVEGSEGSSAPLVYADHDSGWLVIWTADDSVEAGS